MSHPWSGTGFSSVQGELPLPQLLSIVSCCARVRRICLLSSPPLGIADSSQTPALAASSAPTPKADVTFHWIASHSVFQRGGYTEEPDWMQSSKMQPHQHRREEYSPSLSFSPRCSPACGWPLLPQGSIAGLHSTLSPQGSPGPSPQSCSPAS